MTSIKNLASLKWVFLLFFLIFTLMSFNSMLFTPFHDFDEAHRAENAKRMKEYKSFLVPITGSSQDRTENLQVPLKQNPNFHLYYHLERPPLVYMLMIISTSIFGTSEWSYRLPSFLLGMLSLVVFLIFAKKENDKSILATSTGFLALITSSDLWLSSQYAQMDTGITLFLFLSLLMLIYFCSKKKPILIYFSGIFFGLGLLSKLQPAVIFIFPLAFLILDKRINLTDFLRFVLGVLIPFLPWVIYLIIGFGIKNVIQIMPGFALSSASIIDIHHKAPFFWYIRWWWEAFRPGWTLFLALLIYDIRVKNLNWKKITLLSYIFGGLISFSIPDNKIWWYVLPLIPAVGFYIFLSTKDYLVGASRINNLSFAILVASLPLFLRSSNTHSIIYGFAITIISYLILAEKITLNIKLLMAKKNFFNTTVLLSLVFFLLQFPKIIPYHFNTKPVAEFYKSLPYPKCLWVGDMPTEAVLFYSDSGEAPLLNEESQIFYSCPNNYLITPERSSKGALLMREGNIRLYQLTKDHEVLQY